MACPRGGAASLSRKKVAGTRKVAGSNVRFGSNAVICFLGQDTGLPASLFLYGIYISRAFALPRIYTLPRIPLASEMEAVMLDAIFLCAGLAFFAAAIGYTLICEKL
jgi:hypothetical protein